MKQIMLIILSFSTFVLNAALNNPTSVNPVTTPMCSNDVIVEVEFGNCLGVAGTFTVTPIPTSSGATATNLVIPNNGTGFGTFTLTIPAGYSGNLDFGFDLNIVTNPGTCGAQQFESAFWGGGFTVTCCTPPTITSTTDGERCGPGTLDLEAEASTGDVKWWDSQTGGILLFTGTMFTTPPISVSTSYWVEADDNGCVSVIRTEVVATITDIPTITSTTDGERCGPGTVVLGATASAGVINWYANSTGGSSLGTGTSFTTPSISVTTSYWAEADNAGCISTNRTEVIATVKTVPTITSTTDGERCGPGTVVLGATASAGVINWYANSTGGSSLGTGTSFTTPSISVTTSYWVDATDNGCVTGSRTEVVATITDIPTITSTTDGERCGPGTVVLGATASAGVINWYANSTGGSSLGTGTTFTTPSISVTTSYWVDATDNGCVTGSRTEVVATFTDIPTITSTTDGERCGPGTVVLGATASAGVINWYANSTGGSSLGTGTSFTTPSISVTTSYWAEADNAGCISTNRTEVIATVKTVPTITSTTDGERCGPGTVVLGATASAGVINWYANSTGGSSLGTGTSFTTPSISVTTSYWVDATDNGCVTGSRTEVVATITDIPTITSTTDGERCGPGTVVLGATASAGVINWYANSTGGSSLGTGTSFTTPSISVTTSYWVDATDNGCVTGSRTEVVATITDIPTITSTTDGERCGTGTVLLEAESSDGDVQWWDSQTGGTLLDTGDEYETQSISVTTSYWVDATDNGCVTGSRTEVVATITDIPTITSTTDGERCGPGTVVLGATASAGVINWYANSTGGSSLGTGTSFTTPSISVTTSYWVDATDNGCVTGSRTEVVATITDIPTITSTTDGERCGPGTVVLGATASAGVINWYANSTGGSSLGTGTSFTTPSISVTTSYWAEADNAGCISTNRTEVIATVKTVPTITSTTDGERCGPGTLDLEAEASTGDVKWWDSQTGGILLFTGTMFTTPPISVSTSYWVEADDNGCVSVIRTEVVATITDIPTITSTTDGERCGPGTVVLGATASAGVINWYANSTGGSSLGTGTSFTTPSISVTTSYWAEADNAGCISTNRTEVIATVKTVPTITSTTDGERCGPGTVVLGATASAGVINWYANSTGGSSLGTGTSFTTPSISVTTSYWAEADNAGCISTNRTEVIATVKTVPTITSTTDGERCGPGTVVLGATASAGVINWYANSTGGSSLGIGTSFTTPSISVTTSYWVDATDNGCVTGSRTKVTAVVYENPNAELLDITICDGVPGTISVPLCPGCMYTWLPNGETTNSISVTEEDTYSVVVTSPEGCVSSGEAEVTVSDSLETNLEFIPECVGESTIIYAQIGYLTYQWTKDGAVIGTADSLIVDTPGIYSLEVSNGSCSGSGSIEVLFYPVPTMSVSDDVTICVGDSIEIAAMLTGGTPPYTITCNQGLGIGGSHQVSPLVSTTYVFTGSDVNGCSQIDSVTVFVNSLPDVPALVDQTICLGDTIDICIENVIHVVSTWQNGDITCTELNPTDSSEFIVTHLDTLTNCSFTDTVMVFVNIPLEYEIIGGGGICLGATVSLTLTDTTNVSSVKWFKNDTLIGTADTLLVEEAGTYVAQVTDVNGCIVITNEHIVIESDSLNFEFTGDTLNCFGSSGSLGVFGTFDEYLWTLNGVTVSTTSTMEFNTSGTVELIVTNVNGCTGTNSTEVIIYDEVVIDVNSTDPLCFGGFGSAVFTFTGGYGSGYEPSMTGDSLVAEEYMIMVTDGFGCTAVTSFHIGEPSEILIDLVNGEPVISGGTPPYTIISQETEGSTTTVVVEDANECPATAQFIIDAVADEELAKQISVYPNPVTGAFITIEYSGDVQHDVHRLYIRNSIGQLLKTYEGTTEKNRKIPIDHLCSGTYYLQFTTRNRNVFSTKKVTIIR